MPPFTTAFSLDNDYIVPKDYFGKRRYPSIKVYDPGNTDDWYERADVEISRYLEENDADIMVIRGYGVYAIARDMRDLAKKFAVVENSCRLLLYNKIN